MRAAETGRRTFRSGYDYLLAMEAVAFLAVARLGLDLLPFHKIVQWMETPIGRSGECEPQRIAIAVERAARRVPWRSVCIHQGIAAQRMLRRRGIDSRFVYGLSGGSEPLTAHVWIEHEGQVLVGAAAADDFHRVATFPRVTAVDPGANAL